MLGVLQRLSGARGAGTWAVTSIPGGTGNSGGFYLAVPATSRHQQATCQLAMHLTGQQAGPPLVQAGAFPASTPAITAVADVRWPGPGATRARPAAAWAQALRQAKAAYRATRRR